MCLCGREAQPSSRRSRQIGKAFAVIRFGFLSTYPPTLCGLASFTDGLRAALPGGAVGGVVRVVDSLGEPRPAGVVGELVPGSSSGCHEAAMLLNQEDIAVIQHDYGIYHDDDLPLVLSMLSVPAVVVLHTVLAAPTGHQRAALNRVVGAAAAVVTMSETARELLVAGYDVAPDRVHVIRHGAHTVGTGTVTPHRNQQRQILTWGLFGPGMGVEWAIEAMAMLGDLRPTPRYVVAGETHPRVLARDGDRYRDSLVSLAEDLRVSDRVRFDLRYPSPASLRRLVARAEIVLLPYDSRDQVTSGVLVEAVASRTPVVATGFPHAVELLSGGAGVLVNHRDPVSIANAVRMVLSDRAMAARMAAAAGVAGTAGWGSVAGEYGRLAARLVRTAAAVVA
jgi:polysaccharide biosynthesis protein PslF